MSADARTNQMNRLLAAGADPYLTEPLDLAAVLGLLNALVGHSAGTPG